MTPNIQPMDTPSTRAEFELRFHHLHEAFKNGKMHILPDMVESILRVRRLPNGRIDFLSVDETARLQANMIHQFSNMQDIISDGETQGPLVDP
jgi:hypothetical protein